MSSQDLQYVRITNTINLSFALFLCLPLIASTLVFTHDGIDSYGRYLVWIAFSALNIALNFYHRHFLSKIITVLCPLFCGIIVPVFFHDFIHAGMFLWIPFAIMIFGTIPFFIFSYEKEKGIMFFMIALYGIAVFGLDEVLFIVFKQRIDFSFIKNNYTYYINAKVFLFIFLYSSFFIFKIMYYNTKKVLVVLTEKLNDKNLELVSLNKNLELRIEERTLKIKQQNQRIKNLAYTNSHEIRAYIARILGLIYILEYDIPTDEQIYFKSKLKENAIALNELTKELSARLIEEEEGFPF
jgi:signal transduction histidine kinase